MGIFLDCIVFLAGSLFERSFAGGWEDVSAPEILDFVEGSNECFAVDDALMDSLSLAVLLELFFASEATFWAFLPTPFGIPSLTVSPPTTSEPPLASSTPVFPPSADLCVSLGLRAVLKKDNPFSSALLLLCGPLDGGAAFAEEATAAFEDRRLVIEELLLELLPTALFSAVRPILPSARPAALDFAGGPPAFLSGAGLVRESRLVLLSGTFVRPEAEPFSPAPLGEDLRWGCELCNAGELPFFCWTGSECNASEVWDDPFLEGVAVLEEPALLLLGGPSLLSFDADAALLACDRGGSLSLAGDAGESELEDVEEVAGRFLGLLSLSNPVFAELLFTLSVEPCLCFASFATAPWRGLTCSAPAAILLLSPGWTVFLCSACAKAFEWRCSINRLLPGLLFRDGRVDLAPSIFSDLGEPVKQDVDRTVSTTSPILSNVGEEEWDSREKREGELERSWSLAEWAHNGLVPFSLSASGLAMEDLEEKFCLCMPLTIGRLNKPASQTSVRDF